MYKCNIEARSRNHHYRRKAIIIVYSESLSLSLCVASFIQHEKRMRRFILSMACLFLPNYTKLSHKRQDFRRTFFGHKTCVSHFSTNVV